jgi:hypothetical protein
VTKGAINPDGPRTAELHSAGGEVSVQLTLFWDGFGPKQLKPDEEKLAEILRTAVEAQYVPASVEKKMVLEKLKGADASGIFARFTDAEWVGKKPPPGQFANVATGMVRCGDLWGNFTILTQGRDGPSFKQGLTVIESLRKAGP